MSAFDTVRHLNMGFGIYVNGSPTWKTACGLTPERARFTPVLTTRCREVSCTRCLLTRAFALAQDAESQSVAAKIGALQETRLSPRDRQIVSLTIRTLGDVLRTGQLDQTNDCVVADMMADLRGLLERAR